LYKNKKTKEDIHSFTELSTNIILKVIGKVQKNFLCFSEGSIGSENNLDEEAFANGLSGNGNVPVSDRTSEQINSFNYTKPRLEDEEDKEDSDDGKVSAIYFLLY
jgi:hypothetical protein